MTASKKPLQKKIFQSVAWIHLLWIIFWLVWQLILHTPCFRAFYHFRFKHIVANSTADFFREQKLKRAKISELAYTMLKLSWLYRSQADEMPETTLSIGIINSCIILISRFPFESLLRLSSLNLTLYP